MTDSNTAEWDFFSVEQRWFYSAQVIEVFVKAGDRLEHDTLLARVESESGKIIDLFNDTPKTGVIVELYWTRGKRLNKFDPTRPDEIDVFRYWYNQPEEDGQHPLLANAQSQTALIPIKLPEYSAETTTITEVNEQTWVRTGDVLFKYLGEGGEMEALAECDGFLIDKYVEGTRVDPDKDLGYILIGWKPKGYQR